MNPHLEDFFGSMAIMAVLFGIAALGYVGYRFEKKRTEAFLLLAQRLGLRFAPGKDRTIPLRYGFLDALAKGDNRYAYNVMSGTYRDQPVQVFDYHYQHTSTDSKGRRTTHHTHFSYFALLLPVEFPELRVYPENFLSRIGQALGFDDIDFESVEFSRAFTVRSKDKKFAYDVCNARMMELMLQNTSMSLEIEAGCLAMGKATRLDPEKIQAELDRLIEVRLLMPEYLFT
jgi:hypothetical protein